MAVGHFANQGLGAAEPQQGGIVLAVAQFDGLAQRLFDIFGIGQELGFIFKFLLLAVVECGLRQFVEEELVVVVVFAVLLLDFGEFLEAVFQCCVLSVSIAIFVQLPAVVGQTVEQRSLERAVAQQKCGVLRVDIYQCATQLLQKSNRHWSVVDKGARFASRQYFASDNDCAIVVIVDIVVVE